MKIWKPIAIIQTIIIVVLLLVLFKDKSFNFEERRIKSIYEKIKNKTVLQMTESEWEIRNKYKLMEAIERDTLPGTISYNRAKERAKLEIKAAEMFSPCKESILVDAFHNMMEFNMPYEKYNKDKITVQYAGDCTIRINVTTTGQDGWKTFWIFEISYNEAAGKHEMKTMKKDFLG